MRFHPPWHGFRRGGPRLRRQLFAWLALTILVTTCSVAGVLRLAHPVEGNVPERLARIEAFARRSFAETWEDSARRRELARALAEAFGMNVRVSDARGRVLDEFGSSCDDPQYTLLVEREGQRLGSVAGCIPRSHRRRGPFVGLLAILAAAVVLWTAAAILARKLTHPLSSLIAVTREIGSGNLKSRVRLGRHQRGELGLLADAVNDMAGRIERQLGEQRELLAVVSHEVRSPLARLRLSTELLRDEAHREQALLAIEREVEDIDALVGKLLASSRLDFGSLSRAPLDAAALARSALERRKSDPRLLDDQSGGAHCVGDPTLISRALDNVLENAERHGTSLARLVVRRARPGEHVKPADAVVYEVFDGGAGFDTQTLPRAFDAFFRAPNGSDDRHASLGLGLSLVRRIAEAHGGRAWAENVASGGAKVGFSVG